MAARRGEVYAHDNGVTMRRFPETIDLKFLLDAHIDLAPAENVGATPLGTRSIFVVTGGTFEGPWLHGAFRSGGGDWGR